MRDDVRIKAYGLFEFTRSGYLKVQAVVLPATLLLIVVAFLWTPTGVWAANPIFVYLEWIMLLVLVAELAETAVMLGKFRAKAESR